MTNTQGRTRFLARALPIAGGALALGMLMTVPSSATSPQAAGTPLPGYWEYTTSALGIRDTETKCVRPSEINRFFGGLSTNRWRCTYPTRVVGNGRVALRQPVPLGVRGGGGDDQVFAGTGVELGFGPVPVFRIHRNVPGGGFKRNAQRFLELPKII